MWARHIINKCYSFHLCQFVSLSVRYPFEVFSLSLIPYPHDSLGIVAKGIAVLEGSSKLSVCL